MEGNVCYGGVVHVIPETSGFEVACLLVSTGRGGESLHGILLTGYRISRITIILAGSLG